MRSLNGRIPDSDDPEFVDEILEGNDDDNDDTPLDDTQRSVRLMLRSNELLNDYCLLIKSICWFSFRWYYS